MSLFFILFFISLFGIIVLIGRKILIVQNSNMRNNIIVGDFAFIVSDLEDVKHITNKKLKQYGYILLVSTMRLYFKSENIGKKFYKKSKIKIENLYKKYFTSFKKNTEYAKVKESSSFLSTIGEYKKKINKIKHRIKEEESL